LEGTLDRQILHISGVFSTPKSTPNFDQISTPKVTPRGGPPNPKVYTPYLNINMEFPGFGPGGGRCRIGGNPGPSTFAHFLVVGRWKTDPPTFQKRGWGGNPPRTQNRPRFRQNFDPDFDQISTPISDPESQKVTPISTPNFDQISTLFLTLF
jgi:hypothetical protein